jgi:CRISPR-associated protein Cas2
MEILVTYDVATETAEGRRRLRRVAKVCEAHGQRVQKSVFECVLNREQLELLKHALRKEIDLAKDSLRFYRLREPRHRYLDVMGSKPPYDLREPLVV